jgi:hypothetical protein
MAVNRQELGKLFRDKMAESVSAAEEIQEPADESMEDSITEDEPEEIQDNELASGNEDGEEQEAVEEEGDTVAEVEAEDEQEIVNLVDLATAIEVEPEFLYNIKVPLADGAEPLTLSELKDRYTELKRGSEHDRVALQAERDNLESYRNQVQQQVEQQMALPKEILAAQAKVMAIANQYENVDWDTFEQQDAGKAALEKQRLATAFQQAQHEANQMYGTYQSETQKRFAEHQRKQSEMMLTKIPEWSDKKVRVQEQGYMRDMLKGYGYNDDEISSLSDHRAMHMARDLWKMKEMQKSAEKTVTKLKKMPKPLKSKAKAPVNKKVILQKGVQQAKSLKRDRDKAHAIAGLMRGKM